MTLMLPPRYIPEELVRRLMTDDWAALYNRKNISTLLRMGGRLGLM